MQHEAPLLNCQGIVRFFESPCEIKDPDSTNILLIFKSPCEITNALVLLIFAIRLTSSDSAVVVEEEYGFLCQPAHWFERGHLAPLYCFSIGIDIVIGICKRQAPLYCLSSNYPNDDWRELIRFSLL